MNDLQQRISTETALRLLTRQQRRQILRQMADAAEETTVSQLKKHLEVADSEYSAEDDSVERRGIGLHHIHLPMLQDANVIEHDAGRGVVYRGEAFQDVLSLLEAIDAQREERSPPIP
ncbi:DUF7344 domain-containing protein [Halorubrum sp. DTA46]|uniref:DUF7344 domain-containing protein n=1 Tax=Halorubrum sp. DTA46 TaxID=3402162 RepID=UPI003AAC5346